MRLIGHLTEERSARAFADYLYVHGIANQLEHEKEDGWGIWIAEEDQIGRATGLLEDFRKNPSGSKFAEQVKGAAELREREKKDLEAYRKRVKGRRNLFGSLASYGVGPLTFALIIASLAIFTWSRFGNSMEQIGSLFITEFGGNFVWNESLSEIRQGEVWRLITPIFIHFGPLHIIFNMLWLRDLGSMIEGRQSSLHLFALVVVIAVLSNLAQFYYTGSPVFGGMSGVVYGLLGYIWIRGKRDPGSGLYLHRSTVIASLVWFVACLINIIPHVANMAHAAGLAIGAAWGYFSSLRSR